MFCIHYKYQHNCWDVSSLFDLLNDLLLLSEKEKLKCIKNNDTYGSEMRSAMEQKWTELHWLHKCLALDDDWAVFLNKFILTSELESPALLCA